MTATREDGKIFHFADLNEAFASNLYPHKRHCFQNAVRLNRTSKVSGHSYTWAYAEADRPGEEWKAIPKTATSSRNVELSSHGRLRIEQKNGSTGYGQYFTGCLGSIGYRSIGNEELSDWYRRMHGMEKSEMKVQPVLVHRAVTLLFHGPPIDPDTEQPIEPKKLREWEVNHKDRIPSHNEIDNLQWLRASDHLRLHSLVV